MLRCYRIHDNILPKDDKTLLDGIPDEVPNYMKEDKTKDDDIDLDCMLYIYVKEIVSNYTTYFLCAEDYVGGMLLKRNIYWHNYWYDGDWEECQWQIKGILHYPLYMYLTKVML